MRSQYSSVVNSFGFSATRSVVPRVFLAREIVSAILAGTQPMTLTAQRLIQQTDLPLGWRGQVVLLDSENHR